LLKFSLSLSQISVETESSKALGNHTSVSMKFVRFSLLSNFKLFIAAQWGVRVGGSGKPKKKQSRKEDIQDPR
jgi:hypothetical protein